jgi:hypothetical protein
MSKKAIVTMVAAVALSAALGGCTSIPVTTDSNPTMSVATCHTYAFADEHTANSDHQAAFGNPLNAERLREAIQANLAAKGMQAAASRQAADCVVGYAMGTRQVFDDFYGGFGWGYGGGWGRHGWGWGGAWGYDPYVANQTRVTVDLFDARTRVPIWHASATQTVADLTGPNAVNKINAAASAIFAKFPVIFVASPPAGSKT